MMPPRKLGRALWPLLGGFVLCGLLTNTAAAEVRVQTYTYKQVGDLEIKADVYRADDETLRPVVVWIHGGALIMGSRSGIDTDVPYEQSVLMADQFRRSGIDHTFITITEGEHGLAGGDPKEIDQAYQQVFRFVHQRMAGR